MKEKYLEVMQAAAIACGEIILDRSAMTLDPDAKTSSRDVVTRYDLAVQKALMEHLGNAFPEAGFVAEENDADVGGQVVFVIDPIDGTMNFVKNLQHSCISIGCLEGGEPVAAVVYDPYRKELFSAIRGRGAFLNGKPIAVTGDDLADTLALFGTAPYDDASTAWTFQTAHALYEKSLDVRRSGSAALDLCYVACGRAGLYFEAQLSLWDYAAGALIVTEAGGQVTRLDGSPLAFVRGKSSLLAGTSKTCSQSKLTGKAGI